MVTEYFSLRIYSYLYYLYYSLYHYHYHLDYYSLQYSLNQFDSAIIFCIYYLVLSWLYSPISMENFKKMQNILMMTFFYYQLNKKYNFIYFISITFEISISIFQFIFCLYRCSNKIISLFINLLSFLFFGILSLIKCSIQYYLMQYCVVCC